MTTKFLKLEADYQSLLAEFNTSKCKLECKTDSLLILGHEMERCRSERDQYKLMAEQLRERYSALKKRVEGWGPSLLGVYDVRGLKCEREQSLVQLLCELKEQNKSLKKEVEDLKLRLGDAQGDVKIFRDELSKNRPGCLNECSFPNHVSINEKEAVLKQLEIQRQKCIQLTRDLQSVLDEKEDLVTSRDAYRHKFERLNQQLNYMLRGDQQVHVDIDGVLMENSYLKERIKQIQEEKAITAASLSKCKALLEKKRSKTGLRFSAITSGLAISAKQVEQLLQNNPFLDLSSNSSSSSDFRNLVMTLLEALSDKSIALSHQRKTNKILGNRISELDNKIKSMEVSSFLRYNDANQFSYLLNGPDTDELPDSESGSPQRSILSSVYDNEKENMKDPVIDEESIKSDEHCSASDLSADVRTNSTFSDLDILPTKEYPLKGTKYERQRRTSSCSHYSDSKTNSPSPTHNRKFDDSRLSPLKKALQLNSPFKCSIPVTETSGLDIDDLPPNLQKLLIAALAEIDDNSYEQKNKEMKCPSPTQKQCLPGGSVKDGDPSC